jgi:hypothetical protein
LEALIKGGNMTVVCLCQCQLLSIYTIVYIDKIMSDQNKRGTKRKALSLLDKLEIIRRVRNENLKETRGNIAKDFEISESTISVLMAFTLILKS